MRSTMVLVIFTTLLVALSASSMEVGVGVGITEIAKLPAVARTAAFGAIVDTLVAAGIDQVRISIPFWNLVPSDTTQGIDFTPYDDFIINASNQGIHLLGILGCSHPEYALPLTRFSSCTWPDDYYVNGQISATTLARSTPDSIYWKYYVRSIVEHYKQQVDAWEIMNEQNFFGTMFLGTVDEYRDMLRIASTIIRNRDPSSIIVLGGLAALGYQGSTWLECLLDDGAFTYNLFDALNIHIYELDADYAFSVISDALAYLSLSPKPLWLTEAGKANLPFGGQFRSVLGQAFHVPYLIGKFRYAGVSRVYWYTFNCSTFGNCDDYQFADFSDNTYTSLAPLESWRYLRTEAAAANDTYLSDAVIGFYTRPELDKPLFRGLVPYQRCNDVAQSDWARFSTFELADAYGRSRVLSNHKPSTMESEEAFTGIAVDVDDLWAEVDSNKASLLLEVSYAQTTQSPYLQVMYDRKNPLLPQPTETWNSSVYPGTCLEMLSSGGCDVAHTNTFVTYHDGAPRADGALSLTAGQYQAGSYARGVAWLDSAEWNNRLDRKGDLFLRMSDNSSVFIESIKLISRGYPTMIAMMEPADSHVNRGHVSIGGSTMYVCDQFTLRRFDVSNPFSMVELPATIGYSAPYGAAGYDTLMCLADGASGLLVYSTSQEPPELLDSKMVAALAVDVAMYHHYAIVAFSDGFLRIYDIANPSNIVLVCTLCVSPTGVRRVTIQNDMAYALVDQGIAAVNIAVPGQAYVSGTLGVPAGMSLKDIAVANSRAYLADYDGRVHCIDVTNPICMENEGWLNAPGNVYSCAADSNQVCIGCSNGVVTYKVSSSGEHDLWGHGRSMQKPSLAALAGGLLFAYTSDGDGGGWPCIGRASLASDQSITAGSVSVSVLALPDQKADWVFTWKTTSWNIPDNDMVTVCEAGGTPLQCTGSQWTVSGAGCGSVVMGPEGLFCHTLVIAGQPCVPGQRYKYTVSSNAGAGAVVSESRSFRTLICIR